MDDERLWLVERTYTQRDLITLVYATPDGERYLRKERSGHLGGDATAAIDVAPDRLTRVDDDEERERYAAEASRMAEKHDPDSTV
ncbi:hypothetical protein [Halomicrococcus sp. NG-SE-24]|uniref:hypothetical protein n=1 Tax=Halomicrococcus sp. NG-SE-24 TaxID=3436928 RepID=UPI003D99A906